MKFKKLMEILFYELVYQFWYACKIKKKKIISISKYFFMFLGEKMLMSLFLALGRSILS